MKYKVKTMLSSHKNLLFSFATCTIILHKNDDMDGVRHVK